MEIRKFLLMFYLQTIPQTFTRTTPPTPPENLTQQTLGCPRDKFPRENFPKHISSRTLSPDDSRDILPLPDIPQNIPEQFLPTAS